MPSSKRQYGEGFQSQQLDNLVLLLQELKDDLNALRTDFRGHDHGATYAAASWRIHNAAGVAASSGTETNSSVTGVVPGRLIDDSV